VPSPVRSQALRGWDAGRSRALSSRLLGGGELSQPLPRAQASGAGEEAGEGAGGGGGVVEGCALDTQKPLGGRSVERGQVSWGAGLCCAGAREGGGARASRC
jgi:hypothetical protein